MTLNVEFAVGFIAGSALYASDAGSYLQQCYSIEDVLGRGSFGEVVKVVSREDGKAYACKRTLLKYRSQADRSVST